MDRADIEEIARIAGKEGAKEALLMFGIDVEDPLTVQKDFAHLRLSRNAAEKGVTMLFTAMITGLVGFVGTILWLGFKQNVHN